jgi:uncharacterized protein YbaA (DUF1428 family)
MNMTKYVDGYVLPIPKDKIELYLSIASKAGKVWKEHGALEYRECIGDDFEVKNLVSFPRLAGTQPDETVVFSWVVFESREHRDQVNAKVMADPRIKDICDPDNPPFDFKRMAYGGFRLVVDV